MAFYPGVNKGIYYALERFEFMSIDPSSAQNLVSNANCNATLFDRLSSIYESPRNREFYSCTAKLMAERACNFDNLRTGASFLDLACGTGISTEVMIGTLPGVQGFGLDVSSKMLQVAQSKPALQSVRFVHSLAEQTPFADQAFQWIYCNIAYHWLQPRVVDEIKRLIKPDGHLSLIVPLISPSGKMNGNLWLGRILWKFSRNIVSRRSQGLTFMALEEELKDFVIDRAESLKIDEEFSSFLELLDTLDSRSSLSAIFGEYAEDVKRKLLSEDLSSALPVSFRWMFCFIEARLKQY